MNRPYIICHMVTSLDGKVTGDFLSKPECEEACEIYYDINRNLKSNGFICGRVTMEGSFTGGYYPDLSEYEPVRHGIEHKMDFMLDEKYMSGFYAIAFDPEGKLGWKSNKIIDPDGDPGYNGAQIIEVLTEQVDERYLGYLESLEIPYIFAGKNEIDVEFVLFKLKNIVGCETLLLEGGSIVNGYFQRAGVIDELSLVMAPVVADKDDKPLFSNSVIENYQLADCKAYKNSVVWLNYKKIEDEETKIHTIKINWAKPIPLEEAIDSELTNTQGLYYITRKFGNKETSLYLGIATKENTIGNRLKAHCNNWTDLYRGKKYVRVGKITYPIYFNTRDNAELIEHAESALLYAPEHKNLFAENVSKRKSYKFYDLYTVENKGDIFELKPIIDMAEQE